MLTAMQITTQERYDLDISGYFKNHGVHSSNDETDHELITSSVHSPS